MNTKFILISIVVLIVFLTLLTTKIMTPERQEKKTGEIRYVSVGDSYTIGLGVEELARWPNVMVKHLKEAGTTIELMANPAISGYTVRDAIDIELPIVEKAKPDLVTVFIGANDHFSQSSAADFKANFSELLDKLQSIVSDKRNIVLITIPDYSKSPAVQEQGIGTTSESIAVYNVIIKEEGKKRNLSVADIFPVSQKMIGREDYIDDGLHPSETGYKKWEKVIFPVVMDLLKD